MLKNNLYLRNSFAPKGSCLGWLVKQRPKELGQQGRFLVEAADNDISETVATALFERLERVADLGSSKAHFFAFAHICYATAYFKAHFPLEFKAANSTCMPTCTAQKV